MEKEKINKTQQVKVLALGGAQLPEIVEKTQSSPGYVYQMLNRLRKSANFDIKLSAAGRAIDGKKQGIIDTFHRFNTVHGFFPKQQWVASLFGVVREYARQCQPPKTDKIGKFTTVKTSFILSDKFLEFVDGYGELFGLTRIEAMQSISHNLDFSDIDFKSLKEDMVKKAEERGDVLGY